MIRFLAAIFAFLLMLTGPASAAKGEIEDDGWREEQEAVRGEIEKQFGPDNSHVLVIGISEFDDRAWGALGGVKDEYNEVIEAFESHGFRLAPQSRLGRVTAAELTAAIAGFIASHGGAPERRLAIYIAAHGYAAPQQSKRVGYLVASDTLGPKSESFAASAYSVDTLSQQLLNLDSRHVYLFFNACFSGALVPEVRGEDETEFVRPFGGPPMSPAMAEWTLDNLVHNARLVLTAGSDGQLVPDTDNPFSKSVIDGLSGAADGDRDGLILGNELAQYVRGRVARETRAVGRKNDPVFAVLPKVVGPGTLDYRQQGDFVFLSPRGARKAEESDEAAALRQRRDRLLAGQFTDCAECPVMTRIPGDPPLAFARTEVTYAQWEACYRELGCSRWMDDFGQGRGDRPAQGVSWRDALEYLQWLSIKSGTRVYRLPTEAEWTRAAMAGSATRFPWGAEPGLDRAVCWGCGGGMTGSEPARAASLPANGYGLHDMIGNLWEWIDDPSLPCDFAAMLPTGRCPIGGKLKGGAFSTRAGSLTPEATATLPRGPLAPPTVGLRPVAEMGGE